MSDRDFAAAVRMAETGSFDGQYRAAQGVVRRGRKLGAYGVAADDWEELAARAGLAGANWQDPKAQDMVVKRAFDELYAKYHDWRLVAVAWKAGEDVADAVAADPGLLAHEQLREVKEYTEGVMGHANESYAVNRPENPDGSPQPEPMPGEETGPVGQPFPAATGDLQSNVDGYQSNRSTGEDYMRRVLTAMRNGVRAGGGGAEGEGEPAGSREPNEQAAEAPVREGAE